MFKLITLCILMFVPLVLAASEMDPALVYTKAYVCDYDQVSTLYQATAPILFQKNEADLIGKQFFVVVEVINETTGKVQGDLTVTWKGREDYVFANGVILPPGMKQPNYFIWAVHHGLLFGYPGHWKPVDIAASWKNLRIYKRSINH